jgi:hypothetical protein
MLEIDLHEVKMNDQPELDGMLPQMFDAQARRTPEVVLSASDALLAVATICFDVSVLELFHP